MVDKNFTFQERREEIKNKIIDIGVDNINKTNLAKGFGVSRETIYNDIRAVLDNIPQQELDRERSKTYYGFMNAEKRLLSLIEESGDKPELQLKAVDIYTKALERKARVFESFGLKEKVADKLEMNMKDEIMRIVTPKERKINPFY